MADDPNPISYINLPQDVITSLFRALESNKAVQHPESTTTSSTQNSSSSCDPAVIQYNDITSSSCDPLAASCDPTHALDLPPSLLHFPRGNPEISDRPPSLDPDQLDDDDADDDDDDDDDLFGNTPEESEQWAKRTIDNRDLHNENQRNGSRERQRKFQEQRRISETPEERATRLHKGAARQRSKRQSLTGEEREKQKEINKMKTRARRAKETEAEREIRKIKDRERMRERRALIKQIRDLGPEVVAQSCVQVLDSVAQPSLSASVKYETLDIQIPPASILQQHLPPSLPTTPHIPAPDTTNMSVEGVVLYNMAKQLLAEEHQKYLTSKEKQRTVRQQRRQIETAEDRLIRLGKAAERQRRKRQNQTAQEKFQQKEINRLRARKRRAAESTTEREYRKIRERQRRRDYRSIIRTGLEQFCQIPGPSNVAPDFESSSSSSSSSLNIDEVGNGSNGAGAGIIAEIVSQLSSHMANQEPSL